MEEINSYRQLTGYLAKWLLIFAIRAVCKGFFLGIGIVAAARLLLEVI